MARQATRAEIKKKVDAGQWELMGDLPTRPGMHVEIRYTGTGKRDMVQVMDAKDIRAALDSALAVMATVKKAVGMDADQYQLVSQNGYVQFTGTKEQCEEARKTKPQPSAFKVVPVKNSGDADPAKESLARSELLRNLVNSGMAKEEAQAKIKKMSGAQVIRAAGMDSEPKYVLKKDYSLKGLAGGTQNADKTARIVPRGTVFYKRGSSFAPWFDKDGKTYPIPESDFVKEAGDIVITPASKEAERREKGEMEIKSDRYRRRVMQGRAAGDGVGIGSKVKLNSPIDGFGYGIVRGWTIKKESESGKKANMTGGFAGAETKLTIIGLMKYPDSSPMKEARVDKSQYTAMDASSGNLARLKQDLGDVKRELSEAKMAGAEPSEIKEIEKELEDIRRQIEKAERSGQDKRITVVATDAFVPYGKDASSVMRGDTVWHRPANKSGVVLSVSGSTAKVRFVDGTRDVPISELEINEDD